MGWNYDTGEMPKGHWEDVVLPPARGGTPRKTRRHVAPRIIAASATCNTVTITRWLPDEKLPAKGRWEMFAEGETPLCWMPLGITRYLPSHPLAHTTEIG